MALIYTFKIFLAWWQHHSLSRSSNYRKQNSTRAHLLHLSQLRVNSEMWGPSLSCIFCSWFPLRYLLKNRVAITSSFWSGELVPVDWLQSFACAIVYTSTCANSLQQKGNRYFQLGATERLTSCLQHSEAAAWFTACIAGHASCQR